LVILLLIFLVLLRANGFSGILPFEPLLPNRTS